ncbi:glycosyltransferase family 9 protein [Phenylobacterium sp. J367]|uniref:glycosyltransferase family 9 protein n=1 Tax=Phenylobacterium sp. J367 TaxID=2898435 RepID=UPI0021513089|nr:glycosyltransferase family 9 protein [Phenylobacterium sp. J367]MCR5879962.1 hypothetical protein [Phenylobacterium sp. J367]
MSELAARFAEAARHHQQGRLPEAEAGYRAVLAGQGDHLGALANLGSLLRAQDRVLEAEAPLVAAVALAPPGDLRPLVNLANLYRRVARWNEAAGLYDRVIAAGAATPDLLQDAADALLGAGRLEDGWRLKDARPNLQVRRGQGIGCPEWRGEPLAGRSLLLLPEQGFGDQIQAIRYVPRLKAMGAGRVTVLAQAPLVRLLAAMPGVDAVIACGPDETVPVPAHDLWTMPFSLPLHVGGLPSPPYLATPDAAKARWRDFAEGRIGVVWHGNPAQPVERYRGLPSPDLLAPLARHGALADLQDPRGDFADTAAILDRLDLVITTDTAMAHLAGALGRPCFVMLPYIALDWRWADGRRTPWYPELKLFRQPAPGDWASVVAAMDAALEGRLSGNLEA